MLKDAGIPLVLASARSPIGLAHVHQHLYAADAAICFNGAWVGSFRAMEAIAEKRIPSDLAIDAMATVHDQGGSPIWFLLDGCVALRSDEAVARHQTKVTGDPLTLIDRPMDAPETPYKIMATMDANTIAASVTSMTERYQSVLEITQSGSTLVEIVMPDAGKDLAAQHVIEKLGIDVGSVAAADDSDNDAKLLDWATLAITVDNAKPHIKATTDIVTASCDEGGIASALEWIATR